MASSTKTKSTSVSVLAICLNFGRKPFKAVRIRLLDSDEMLAPKVALGVEAVFQLGNVKACLVYSQTSLARPNAAAPFCGLLGADPCRLSALGPARPESIHLFILSYPLI